MLRMGFDRKDALADIDAVLARTYSDRNKTSNYSAEATALDACIHRYTEEVSAYRKQADPFRQIIRNPNSSYYAVTGLKGIVQALRADIDGGVLQGFQSRITADIFADLLAQADGLLFDHFLLPAAVLAGATLEEHLRKLATKNSIATTDASGKPRKATSLNADLKQANVYSNAQHAQVDAWQKIRNEAAHGQPSFQGHNDADIGRMIAGIRDFILKYPA